MRIENSTPFLFGYRATSWKRTLEMTAVVRARFHLSPSGVVSVPDGHPLLVQGAMTGDTFADDDDECNGEVTDPSDFAEFKRNAEVMLRGHAYAPGGKPVKELPVKFAVGSWSKILRVVGRRVYTRNSVGAIATEPIAFSSMPITYANAFGGPGYDSNPVGKGYKTDELPNVEYPEDVAQSSKERRRPASFGPINPFWPERAAKLGRKVSAPKSLYYPDDFDISYFQSAPSDQQLPKYIQGDEEIVLQNLHPTIPILSTRLPGLRMRVFVLDMEGSMREVPLVIDTLFVDMHNATVTLSYRGSTPCKSRDLHDIVAAFVDSEPLDAQPKPRDHYVNWAKDAEADPYQIRQRVPEELQGIAYEALHEKRITAPVENSADADTITKLLQSKLGHLLPGQQERIRELLAKATQPQAPYGASLQSQLEAGLAAAVQSDPPAIAPVPGVVNLEQFRVRQTLQKVRELIDSLKRDAAKKNIRLQGLENAERALADPRFAIHAAEAVIPKPEPGADYSGQDASGWDFSGKDLSGANFNGAILTGANFRGSILRGATFKQAILQNADFSGADASLADFTRANATGMQAEGAIFQHATLHEATFASANLRRADLSNASGRFTVWTGTDMSNSNASGVKWEKNVAHQATMTEADFSGASLTNCHLGESDLRSARFDDANLVKTTFQQANLEKTKFIGAKGEAAAFLEARLVQTDFAYSSIERPFFSGAKVERVRFYGANIKDAQFCRAKIDDTDLQKANLAGANFETAQITKTTFDESNLFESNFRDAAGRSCTFDKAILTRSSLENT